MSKFDESFEKKLILIFT